MSDLKSVKGLINIQNVAATGSRVHHKGMEGGQPVYYVMFTGAEGNYVEVDEAVFNDVNEALFSNFSVVKWSRS